MTTPEVSIIVAVRQAPFTIRTTLASLSAQCKDLDAEVIALVSADDSTRNVLKDFTAPGVRVIIQPPARGVPQLRRDGVLVSRAPYFVITEDHCTFPDGWLKRLLNELRDKGAVAAGGPVLNGRRTFSGWAQYFTRYAAFMLPVANGATRYLPGNNAIYARASIESYLPLIEDGFWEAEFNHALLADKHAFWMNPDLAIEQHQHRGAFAYLPLRFRHGRCYGGRRFRAATSRERWRLLAATPLIPLILYWRAARNVIRKRRHMGIFLITTPLQMCYFGAWAAGETAGYVFGQGTFWWDTD
jgi:glycosyltransferase involved in cell wall biosynthesis